MARVSRSSSMTRQKQWKATLSWSMRMEARLALPWSVGWRLPIFIKRDAYSCFTLVTTRKLRDCSRASWARSLPVANTLRDTLQIQNQTDFGFHPKSVCLANGRPLYGFDHHLDAMLGTKGCFRVEGDWVIRDQSQAEAL